MSDGKSSKQALFDVMEHLPLPLKRKLIQRLVDITVPQTATENLKKLRDEVVDQLARCTDGIRSREKMLEELLELVEEIKTLGGEVDVLTTEVRDRLDNLRSDIQMGLGDMMELQGAMEDVLDAVTEELKKRGAL